MTEEPDPEEVRESEAKAAEAAFYKEVRRRSDDCWASVRNPVATAEELRQAARTGDRIVREFLRSALTRTQRFVSMAESWKRELDCELCSHPNFPLDVFGREVQMDRDTVRALLRNPVAPLLFLECPDFLDQLPSYGLIPVWWYFTKCAVHCADVPFPILQVLMAVDDPWLALEAETHQSAHPPDTKPNSPPDLNWLNARVAELLHTELKKETAFWDRCLVYELGNLGHLSPNFIPNPPWQTEPHGRNGDFSPEAGPYNTRAFLAGLRSLDRKTGRKHEPQQREFRQDWLKKWLLGVLKNPHISDAEQAARIVAAFTHPATPRWVLEVLPRDWYEYHHYYKYDDRRIGAKSASLFRWMESVRLGPTDAMTVRNREQAMVHAMERRNDLPGLFHLLVRDRPDIARGGPWDRTDEGKNPDCLKIGEALIQTSFLIRLTICLNLEHLDDRIEVQKYVRDHLADDPNVYVRAAARREIVWPVSSSSGVRKESGGL